MKNRLLRAAPLFIITTIISLTSCTKNAPIPQGISCTLNGTPVTFNNGAMANQVTNNPNGPYFINIGGYQGAISNYGSAITIELSDTVPFKAGTSYTSTAVISLLPVSPLEGYQYDTAENTIVAITSLTNDNIQGTFSSIVIDSSAIIKNTVRDTITDGTFNLPVQHN